MVTGLESIVVLYGGVGSEREVSLLSGQAIADALFLSKGTVRNYVSNILSKLHVANRAEAAAYAIEHKLQKFIED